MRTDRDRFRIQKDRFMDEVHGLRDRYAADVAILITDSGGGCGIASAILANAATGFGVAKRDCATGNYTFGHEIGHLQGARHNPEADPSTNPFPYGHGYYYQPGRWRTIMSYNCPNGCTRGQFWSTPDLVINGVSLDAFKLDRVLRIFNCFSRFYRQVKCEIAYL